MSDLIFTYGSLQKGGRLYHLLERSEFLGEAWTKPSFNLYDCGSWPAMTHRGSTSVHGETYRVTQPTLEDLDQVEGSPHLFSRSVIRVPQGEAWAYFYKPATTGLPIIESGIWDAAKRPGPEDEIARNQREADKARQRFQEDREAIGKINDALKTRTHQEHKDAFKAKKGL